MRKFNSPVNLKAAADSFVSEAFIDVTLTELVSAHSIARPLLALHFRLKKWCDLVNGKINMFIFTNKLTLCLYFL